MVDFTSYYSNLTYNSCCCQRPYIGQIDRCQGRFVASMFPRKHFDQNDSKLRQGSLQSDEKQEAKTQNTSNFLVSLCFPAFNLKTEGHHSFCWDFGKV